MGSAAAERQLRRASGICFFSNWISWVRSDALAGSAPGSRGFRFHFTAVVAVLRTAASRWRLSPGFAASRFEEGERGGGVKGRKEHRRRRKAREENGRGRKEGEGGKWRRE